MAARLIINADDFGLTPGINRAVAELHRANILPSATLMASGPAFADAVATARTLPTLGVGCHLVFVDGTPISPPHTIPSLLGPDRRTFHPTLASFAAALLRGAILPEDLAREARAQIGHLQHAGIHPTHVDTHKHTHLFPAVARAVLPAARHCGVACIRNPFEPLWARRLSRTSAPLSRRLSWQLLQSFASRTAPLLSRTCTPQGTLGVLATGALTPALLQKFLQKLSTLPPTATFELCVHPGHLDPTLASTPTRLRQSRAGELHLLLSHAPQIRSACTLTSYASISGVAAPPVKPHNAPNES